MDPWGSQRCVPVKIHLGRQAHNCNMSEYYFKNILSPLSFKPSQIVHYRETFPANHSLALKA